MQRDSTPRPIVHLAPLFERDVPQAPYAESCLLGAIILCPENLPDIRAIVKHPDMFYKTAHSAIYAAMCLMADTGKGGDIPSLCDYLRDKGTLEDIGGDQYMVDLVNGCPGPAGWKFWASSVYEKWLLRRAIEVCGTGIHQAFTDADNPLAVLERLEAAVFELNASNVGDKSCQPMSEIMQAEFERIRRRDERSDGLASGFHELDKLLGGLINGDMIVVAGRPSMGKTSLALDIARMVAMRGVPVGVFSLEMSKSAVSNRCWAADAGVSIQRLIQGTLTPQEYEDAFASSFAKKVPPIVVEDGGGLSVANIASRARRLVRRYGIKLLIVDYMQLITDPQRRESRQVEVSAISGGLKRLAKELGIPLVVVSQLNRLAESRADSRPRMSDLRESGAIEQDADVILLLHREEYYHVGDTTWFSQNPDKIGHGELIVAKQRNGPTGSVSLTWRGECSSFANHTPKPYTEDAPIGLPYADDGDDIIP